VSWTVVLALVVLLVAGVVLYRSRVVARRPNPELEALGRRSEELRARLDRAEERLDIGGGAPSHTDEEDRR